jgi:hypothetical protein
MSHAQGRSCILGRSRAPGGYLGSGVAARTIMSMMDHHDEDQHHVANAAMRGKREDRVPISTLVIGILLAVLIIASWVSSWVFGR